MLLIYIFFCLVFIWLGIFKSCFFVCGLLYCFLFVFKFGWIVFSEVEGVELEGYYLFCFFRENFLLDKLLN